RHTRFSRDWSSDVCSSDLDSCFGLSKRDLDGSLLSWVCLYGWGLIVLFRCTFVGRAAFYVGVQPLWLQLLLHVFGCHPATLTARSEERRVGKECGRRESAA